MNKWKALLHEFAVRPARACPPMFSSAISACHSSGGAQLAIDTTFVSPIRGEGEPRHLCADHDGAALAQARRRKQRTNPELGGQGRARLVVLAAEVGGRWSEETRSFVSQLAKAKARSAPRVLAGRTRQAWQHRWASLGVRKCPRVRSLSSLDRRPATSAGHHRMPPLAAFVVLRGSCWRVRLSRL